MTGTVSGPGLAPADAIEAARGLAPSLASRAAATDASGVFPAEDFAAIRSAGLLGLLVPERLGGSGGGFADYAEVAMALAAGNGSTALVYNMHASVTGTLALTSDEVARALGVPETFFAMRDRVLRDAVDGALYGVAMSERGVGSPSSPPAIPGPTTGSTSRARRRSAPVPGT
jgi:alkylation response protein AidB-like acyl-CoA dehydrogenase